MKKLIAKDIKLRVNFKESEKKQYILKSIYKNDSFFVLLRWNAFSKLKNLSKIASKNSISPRCIISINKKRFNKLTFFSRQIFLKIIRNGDVTGIKKSSW